MVEKKNRYADSIICPQCQITTCKVTRKKDWKSATIKCSGGVELTRREGEAPTVRCRCGLKIVLLEAQA